MSVARGIVWVFFGGEVFFPFYVSFRSVFFFFVYSLVLVGVFPVAI